MATFLLAWSSLAGAPEISAGESAPRMWIDAPVSGASESLPFSIFGWAVDSAAPTGTGVDTVHVWVFPASGGSPVFLGAATYGSPRPGVAALFGPRFEPSGFHLGIKTPLMSGSYRLRAYARSTVTGTFNNARSVDVSIVTATRMKVEVPTMDSVRAIPFRVSGWAFNAQAPSGVGIDAVHVWASPDGGGAASFLGAANLGESRPDVAAHFGDPRWEPSGFSLDVTADLLTGSYTLQVFARNTVTGRFDAVRHVPIRIGSEPRMAVGRPASGASVLVPFEVTGWAVDHAVSSGTGVDAVHVWAFRDDGAPPVFLGAATLGLSRPDVAAHFGKDHFEPSGFRLAVTSPDVLGLGDYRLTVFARSTVTGTFNNSRSVPIRVTESITLEPFITSLQRPVDIAHASDGTGRLFIVLQGGRILVHDGTSLLPTPFLDIRPLVSCCGERGLLGVAFHPSYSANGHFYVNYTDSGGNTVIARYTVSSNPDVADPASRSVLLSVPQPYANHNGGQLRFGPDGYLYIALGDGGSAGDPGNRAQNLSEYLGKILRIDVDAASPYAIPATNPYVGVPGAKEEIWAFGLRNPWRFSFDRLTGDLFIGDVGQGRREEVNFQPSGSAGGENYGWRLMEGSLCFNPSTGCNDGSLTLPVLEYGHADGNCSVTGGYRYRGAQLPGLSGIHFYADYCSGRIWAAARRTDGA